MAGRKTRVAIDLSARSLKAVDVLSERIGSTSRAETARRALAIFEWLVAEYDSGSTIIARRANGTEGDLVFAISGLTRSGGLGCARKQKGYPDDAGDQRAGVDVAQDAGRHREGDTV